MSTMSKKYGSTFLSLCDQNDAGGLEKWASSNKVDWQDVLEASLVEDADKVAALAIQHGAQVGSSIVAFVVLHGQERIHRMLIEADLADIQFQVNHGPYALDVAIEMELPEWAEFCLEHGADPNRSYGTSDQTALSLAADYNAVEIAEALFKHGARIDNSGAVLSAAESGHVEMLSLLLSRGADINEIKHRSMWPQEKSTALHNAIKGHHVNVIDLLLDAGIDTSIKDGYGRTALEYARELNQADTVEKLEKRT